MKNKRAGLRKSGLSEGETNPPRIVEIIFFTVLDFVALAFWHALQEPGQIF